MLEELIHKQDGTIVSKDPYVHYATQGAKVILIDASLSATNSACVKKNAIGWITERDAYRNQKLLAFSPKDRELYEINVTWNRADLTRSDVYGSEGENTVQFIMLPGAIKPYHD